MLRRAVFPLAAGAALLAAAIAAAAQVAVLPNGWRLSMSGADANAQTGTMPQGIALSPDGKLLAVVESGMNPPALRILETPGLRVRRVIPLKGAFGKPAWLDAGHVLVAGANTDSVLNVDIAGGTVAQTSAGKGTWPSSIAIAPSGEIATANDGSASATVGGQNVRVGDHPADALFSMDGKTLYVSVRGSNEISVLDAATQKELARIPVGAHPEGLALSTDSARLYVAESDDDALGVVDTRTNAKIADIPVGMNAPRAKGYGASPSSIAIHGNDVFVTLAGENAVALVRNGRVAERIPTGWYPTGVAVGADGTLYVSNGKGDGMHANPGYNPFSQDNPQYVASITTGTVRALAASTYANAAAATAAAIANAIPEWTPPPPGATVLRGNGPIRHVIYVIKENRSYDQVLGDIRGADGDPALVEFGRSITPNQHALAQRFGVFDNAYTDAQVSADGHNWTDAAFANDYVERFWPVHYAGRRDAFDFQMGTAPDVPHNGYLWDAALRAHVSIRDYGENIEFPVHGMKLGLNTFAGLRGVFDPSYVGWDLAYSDLSRFDEWKREFTQYAASGNLPQLEIVYLPNDHTSGTVPGKPTPQAYVATNDWAVGKLVDTVSHSKYWNSTAIFILEDDAQNGPDHVSAQRSTFYVASPYARGGVQHGHYSTVSFVRTIELLLGLPPLSIYDATAQPLYDAFALHAANRAAFDAVQPAIPLNETNKKTAYGAAISAKLDFSHPDAADPAVLNAIIAHAGRK